MYSVKDWELTVVDVLDILDNVDLVCVSAHVANTLGGGSVYVYVYTSADAFNDWEADGYRWIMNETVKLPGHSPRVSKWKTKRLHTTRLTSLPSDVNIWNRCVFIRQTYYSHNNIISYMNTIYIYFHLIFIPKYDKKIIFQFATKMIFMG